MNEALAQGMCITRTGRLRGQELVHPRPSIHLYVTAPHSEFERDQQCPLFVRFRHVGRRNETPAAGGLGCRPQAGWSQRYKVHAGEGQQAL